MLLPSIPSTAIVNHLNTTYFNDLWNAADESGRRNFELVKAYNTISTGSVFINESVVGLPTTDRFYAVYSIPASYLGRFITLQYGIWTTDTDILNNMGVQISTYSGSGRKCPSGTVYLRYDTVYANVLVAVTHKYVYPCIGDFYPDLYMTIYRDPSRSTPIISNSYIVSTTIGSTTTPTFVLSKITEARISYPLGTIVYVNGFSYFPTNVPTLVNGDAVEVISDPDIVGYTDVVVDDDITGYYSSKYGEYREVIHIEKAINPNNYILTDNNVDVIVFDPQTFKGLYGHRVDPNAVKSITHNDFSMSRTALQAFQNTLDTSQISVRIYVRFPTEPIVMSDEINRILDLYSLTDDRISKQLSNSAPDQLPEWKASSLEQSEFLTLLYKFTGFDKTEILSKFIESVGYYDVASTLAQSIVRFPYPQSKVTISKPVRLYGIPCDVIAYSDGRKIPNTSVYVVNISDGEIEVSFSYVDFLQPNSDITLYITEYDPATPVFLDTTGFNLFIDLPNDDYDVYQIKTYVADQPVWESTTRTGYEHILLSSSTYTVVQNSNGTFRYTLRETFNNKQFYFVPKHGKRKLDFTIDSILTAGSPIVLNLTMADGDLNVLPLFGYIATEIYTNGKRLIPDIDYRILTYYGTNYDVLQTVLVISNYDFVDLENIENLVEVIVHGERPVSIDIGYSVDRKLFLNSDFTYWSNVCGRAYVNGLLLEPTLRKGAIMETPPIPDGAPFYVEWNLPYGVAKLLRDFSPNNDNVFEARVRGVLGNQTYTGPALIQSDHLYALYSPYISKIIEDVTADRFTIVNDPSSNDFLNQFFPYEKLRAADPTLGAGNNLLDRRFVTLAANYKNTAVTDFYKLTMIRRLIGLLMETTVLTIDDVLI